jgi:hypothetical protein
MFSSPLSLCSTSYSFSREREFKMISKSTRGLFLALALCLLSVLFLPACGTTADAQPGEDQTGGSTSDYTSTNVSYATPTDAANTTSTSSSSGQSPSSSNWETVLGPLDGSGNENTDTFQVNGALSLTWACTASSAQPFEIQMFKKTDTGYSPVGQPIIDSGSACGGTQIIDFQGDHFTGHLNIIAIFAWRVQADTLSG